MPFDSSSFLTFADGTPQKIGKAGSKTKASDMFPPIYITNVHHNGQEHPIKITRIEHDGTVSATHPHVCPVPDPVQIEVPIEVRVEIPTPVPCTLTHADPYSIIRLGVNPTTLYCDNFTIELNYERNVVSYREVGHKTWRTVAHFGSSGSRK